MSSRQSCAFGRGPWMCEPKQQEKLLHGWFVDTSLLWTERACVRWSWNGWYLTESSRMHGLKNNTRLTRFCDPTKKKTIRWRHCSQILAVLRCCVWLFAEMPSSCAVFGLNNCKFVVNRHLRFCQFLKNSEMCLVWVLILTRNCAVWVPWTNN